MDSALLEISYTVIASALLFYFIYRSLYITKRHYLNWFLFGLFLNLYSLSWLYTAYPLAWLSPGPIQLVGITALLLVLACGAGASYALVGYVFTKNLSPWKQVILFTLLIAGAELLRSGVFSLLFAGNGASLGLHWTSGTLGNALSSTPLIEYAYFGGTYTLSAVLGLCIFTAATYKKLKYGYLSYALILMGWLFIHYTIPVNMPTTPLRVGVITTDFSKTIAPENLKTEFATRFGKLDEMTRGLAPDAVDVIAYPEDARYTGQLDASHLANIVKTFPRTLFVDGETQVLGGKLSNFSIFYSPENGNTQWGRGKTSLFPFNEYVPYVFHQAFTLFLTAEELKKYESEHTFLPRSAMEVLPFAGSRIGTLICSEIISFQTIRTLAQKKPTLVVFQTYLSIFNGKKWFSGEDRSFTKIAAAQLRTPLISSANGVESYIVSPYGTVTSVIPQGFHTSVVLVGTSTLQFLR